MTTETTDPLETVMEAADRYSVESMQVADKPEIERVRRLSAERERLRLHVQLALAKAELDLLSRLSAGLIENVTSTRMGARLQRERQLGREKIAALEARLQED